MLAAEIELWRFAVENLIALMRIFQVYGRISARRYRTRILENSRLSISRN